VTTEQVWLAATGAVVIAVALVAVSLAVRAQRRAVGAESAVAELVERLALLEAPVASAPAPVVGGHDETTYVITHLDEDRAAPRPMTAQRLEGRLFADIVARETVVKAASWTHGVRRALAPETRNRIRFHMRQETKRAGRDRKAEMKVALREHRARSRAAAADGSAALGEDVA